MNATLKSKIDKFTDSYRPYNMDGHLAALGELLLETRIEERRKCRRILDRHGFPNVAKLLDIAPTKSSTTKRRK